MTFWRLPAVRVDGQTCCAAQRWLLLVSFSLCCLLLAWTFSVNQGPPHSGSHELVLHQGVALQHRHTVFHGLVTLLAPAVVVLCHGIFAIQCLWRAHRLHACTYYFDGEHWWCTSTLSGDVSSRFDGDKSLEASGPGYAGPLLVVRPLARSQQGCVLMVWRWQCNRESWRRLQLAIRYGVNTVSTATSARSG